MSGIARKLLSAAGAGGGFSIEYVGGRTDAFSGTITTRDISLTSLTGGLASSPATDDLVLVYYGVASGDNRNPDLEVIGYTEVADRYISDTYDANLAVAYKFMGGTPDTTVTVSATGDGRDAGTVAIQVWRGVAQTGTFDVPSLGGGSTNSVLPLMGTIEPVTENSVIVVGAAGAHTQGAATYSSSDLDNFMSVGSNDTNDATIGLGYHRWSSGGFTPAPFTFSGGNSTSFSSAAYIAALRPAEAGPVSTTPVEFLTGVNLANQSSDATRSLTLNSGFSSGDVLVAMTANRTTTAPALLSGYTDIVSVDNVGGRSLRVQYKVATSTSETISWTGAYGYLIALRNFTSVGVTNTRNGSTFSTSRALPDLTGLTTSDRAGFILAGSFVTGIYQSVTSPYTKLGDFGYFFDKNMYSSLTSKNFTASASLADSSYAIELL